METEFANQPIEIQHWDRYDVLINRELPDQQIVNDLVAKVKTDFNTAPEKEILRDWVKRKNDLNKGNVLFDHETNPNYCAKNKWITRYIEEDLQGDITKINSHKSPLNLKKAQTFDSLISELRLYGRVKQAVTTPEFQKVAISRGYSELRTVEPLLGIIDRDTRQKTMIYKYLDAKTFEELGREDSFETKAIALELEVLFSEQGIITTDLSNRQFMVAEEGNHKILYLIDLEGYYPKVKNESS